MGDSLGYKLDGVLEHMMNVFPIESRAMLTVMKGDQNGLFDMRFTWGFRIGIIAHTIVRQEIAATPEDAIEKFMTQCELSLKLDLMTDLESLLGQNLSSHNRR